MPPSPHHLRGGADRLASLSLYKALLGQCRQTTFQDEVNDKLRAVLRNTFRNNKRISGKQNVKTAFYAGYEALDVLKRSNNGDPRASNTILHQLSQLPARLTKPPSEQAIPTQRHSPKPPTASSSRSLTSRPPPPRPPTPPSNPTYNILHRPRPLADLPLNRPRRIPTFVDANGIPFLRTKKPVPNSLSAYISKRIARRQTRISRTEHYRSFALRQAEWEDAWDVVVRGEAEREGLVVLEDVGMGAMENVEGEGSKEGRKGEDKVAKDMRGHEWRARNVLWTDYTRHVVGHLQDQTKAERQKNVRMARAMREIVAKETALAREEKRVFLMQRRLKRRMQGEQPVGGAKYALELEKQGVLQLDGEWRGERHDGHSQGESGRRSGTGK